MISLILITMYRVSSGQDYKLNVDFKQCNKRGIIIKAVNTNRICESYLVSLAYNFSQFWHTIRAYHNSLFVLISPY